METEAHGEISQGTSRYNLPADKQNYSDRGWLEISGWDKPVGLPWLGMGGGGLQASVGSRRAVTRACMHKSDWQGCRGKGGHIARLDD